MPGIGVVVLARDLPLPQVGQQLRERLANPSGATLKRAGPDGTIQGLQLVIWDANRYLL